MTKTALRKSIEKELESKLLLEEASLFQIVKYAHKNHALQMFECALLAGVIGFVLKGVIG